MAKVSNIFYPEYFPFKTLFTTAKPLNYRAQLTQHLALISAQINDAVKLQISRMNTFCRSENVLHRISLCRKVLFCFFQTRIRTGTTIY